MLIDRLFWTPDGQWLAEASNPRSDRPCDHQLVLYFGSRGALSRPEPVEALKALYAKAKIVGCSTGGQISDNAVFDDRILAVALRFEHTRVEAIAVEIKDATHSLACGEALGRGLLEADHDKNLAGVIILCDGLNVNGTQLAKGLSNIIPDVPVSGGLAGDGDVFTQTLVGFNEQPRSHLLVAVGLYGKQMRVKTGHNGGWDVFGIPKMMTKTEGNVLYELDDAPVLDLYKRHLSAEEFSKLPGSALLFPLRIYDPLHPERVMMRSPKAVNHETKSLTFAGDVPEGWMAQLMRGNMDNLAQGAYDAAHEARPDLSPCDGQSLALLVSCVGRRMLMGKLVTGETEAVSDALDENTLRVGFYSYGELSPNAQSGTCELHNQTMTIATLYEAA